MGWSHGRKVRLLQGKGNAHDMVVIFFFGTAHQTAFPTKCSSCETANYFVHARSVKFYKGRHTSSIVELHKRFVTHN